MLDKILVIGCYMLAGFAALLLSIAAVRTIDANMNAAQPVPNIHITFTKPSIVEVDIGSCYLVINTKKRSYYQACPDAYSYSSPEKSK